MRRASSARHSIASDPCPGAGSMRGGSSIRRCASAQPSRVSPAAASTIASYSPVVELSQPRVDVAANAGDVQIGPQVEQLRPPPQAAGADAGAGGKLGERLRDVRHQRVGDDSRAAAWPRAISPATCSRRQILQAVDGQVDSPAEDAPLGSLW